VLARICCHGRLRVSEDRVPCTSPSFPPASLSLSDVALLRLSCSGIGLAMATMLASAGHDVVLACRSRERGQQAVQHVVSVCGDDAKQRVHLMLVDVADLASVATFCVEFKARCVGRVDCAASVAMSRDRDSRGARRHVVCRLVNEQLRCICAASQSPLTMWWACRRL
jgi:NAD(P)-dependent dehydrogenase (short-subunit alcohol dehydrogenase family)